MPRDHAIAVLIVEPHRLVRAGFRLLLEANEDILVVGEAVRGEHAVAGARRLRPDVVLMDGDVPGLDALGATRLIFEAGLPQVRVLLLTASGTDAEVFAALHAGAHGVLLRDSEPGDLLRAVRLIAGGGALLPPGFTRRLAAEVLSRRAHASTTFPELEELTQREREVLALVGHGFSNVEIAERLAVSPATVKSHVGRVIANLEARNRAELVMLAYETGLVLPVGQGAALRARRRYR
ncbi:MAG: putative two component system response regulator [Solirubrobacterales bacterium]|jgi:DNA-binding NarL/FixJ family response regulator|nr:putative two component system response regulator [Solirubrobacterales bacterium]